jgi:hypothetical protein
MLCVLLAVSPAALGFSVVVQSKPRHTSVVMPASRTCLSASVADALPSRRQIFVATASSLTGAVVSVMLLPVLESAQATAAAAAAADVPSLAELDRIRVGYGQITALLNDFDQSTTTCRENGGECKRDADPIRKVLGLRSTTDPLFQIEKVFGKVKNMDLDPDKLDDFFQATEDWSSAIAMSNSMAFISQFGEYNPGGGKDEVLKYLIESKKQVVLAQQALKTIMDCLDLA